MTLHFGFFENFSGSDSLLIWGDAEELTNLHILFGEFAKGKRNAASLNEMPWAESVDGTLVNLQCVSDRDQGIDAHETATRRVINWRCSAGQFAEFENKVAVLIVPMSKAGHHYLDQSGDQPIQIIVSQGEYPPNFGQ